MMYESTDEILANQDKDASCINYAEVDHKDEVVSYLRSNEALALTSGKMTDCFTGEEVKTYCMNCRSDGTYVWGEPLAYYVREYGILLPSDFLEHIYRRLGIEFWSSADLTGNQTTNRRTNPRVDEKERLIEDELYRSAAELIKQRFPSGWGGAAAMRLECRDDTPARIVTSVAIETPNASASLCIETGAMCEAMKLNQRITHTICLVRDSENSPFIVLSPCGICQERLRYWGNDVRCAITGHTNDGRIPFLRLDDLQPHHWTQAYPTSELEHFDY